MLVTLSPFDGVYWCPAQLRTFVCLRRCDGDGVWLPLDSLIGHWDFLTGRVVRVRVLDGFGPGGPRGPKYDQIRRSTNRDADTGACYWRSFAVRGVDWLPRPMAHS